MPSPFPGMDPYLEGSLWTAFHATFAIEIVRQIAPQLRPRYLALPVERVVFEEVTDVAVTTASLYPDVSVVSSSLPPESNNGRSVTWTGAAAPDGDGCAASRAACKHRNP